MDRHDEIGIARAILTDKVAQGVDASFVLAQFRAFRQSGTPIVPAAIMSLYTIECVGHESLVPKVLRHFEFYSQQTMDPIAAAYLAVTASRFELPNPRYYAERQERLLHIYESLESSLAEQAQPDAI